MSNATWKMKGGHMHEQHSYIRVIKKMRHPRWGPVPTRLKHTRFNESQFPNGKIWWSYPWLADKRVACARKAGAARPNRPPLGVCPGPNGRDWSPDVFALTIDLSVRPAGILSTRTGQSLYGSIDCPLHH